MIRISTLGGLAVRGDDEKPFAGAVAQPRRMAILALLARAGERGISREKLLALLWPDADDERGPRALAQALYALRKDLGAEAAITGAKELRLDPALVSSDAGEFASAMARGDDTRAVALYQGPFLDGFHLPGADRFSRWVEQERASLSHEHARALESLARNARARGAPSEAVGWWRKLAALEPLNARVTVGLMEALAAAGDRAGALKHVHVYQLLVQQELDLPPDKEVLALADRLREAGESSSVGSVARVASSNVASAVITPLAPLTSSYAPPAATSDSPRSTAGVSVDERSAEVAPGAPRRRPTPRLVAGIALVTGLAALATVMIVRARGDSDERDAPPTAGAIPTVAVGRIAAFGDSNKASLAAPVADLLATSLARVHGVRVVSQGRMLEIMRHAGNGSAGDTSAGGFVDAARRAGASEIIDGTLYTRPGGRLRLDVRRVDLATGAIGDVRTVEGNDLFALVDSGTTQIVAALGVAGPQGSIADVTTRSITAYRMYERGIRAYYVGDHRTALGFFDAALVEDSLFALAAYYDALSDPTKSYHARMARAKRLAARATDRERLMILVGWAYSVSAPELVQLADTLATRYPTEIQGHLYQGISRVFNGEFLAGLAPLERVLVMDSLGVGRGLPECSACDALQWRVGAYELLDSLPAAEREARRWVRLQPRSMIAAYHLLEVIEWQGREREGDSLFRATPAPEPSYNTKFDFQTFHLIRFRHYAAADRLLLAQIQQSDPQLQSNAYWNLAFSLREQGRRAEALDAARRWRLPTAKLYASAAGAPPLNPLEAQLHLEMNHAAIAAIQYDSLSRQFDFAAAPSQLARGAAWMLTQVANARASAGDTATLERLADSVRVLGAQSVYGRDHRLYHHIRGLLLAARHDDAGAISEFRSAVYSLTAGYTRTNYELARVYMRARRPREAVAVLQPSLRGALEGGCLYVNRTEVHELLAQAWDAAGVRDSAAAHYAIVTQTWAAADADLKPRVEAARQRLIALTR